MNTPLKRPSWSKIIDALMKAGMRQHQIGAKTGISQPFLSNLRRKHRASIEFDAGLKLYSLYAERVLDKAVRLVSNLKISAK